MPPPIVSAGSWPDLASAQTLGATRAPKSGKCGRRRLWAAASRGLLPALGSGPAPAPGQLELNYWRVAQHQTLNYPIAKLHLGHRGFTAPLQSDHRAHAVGIVAYLVAELNA